MHAAPCINAKVMYKFRRGESYINFGMSLKSPEGYQESNKLYVPST